MLKNKTVLDELSKETRDCDKLSRCKEISMPEVQMPKETVDHPSHYADGKIETIDYIEDKKLGFCLGNAIKYISRAGKKESTGMTKKEKEVEDLKKAIWYINRRIYEVENGFSF